MRVTLSTDHAKPKDTDQARYKHGISCKDQMAYYAEGFMQSAVCQSYCKPHRQMAL